MDSMITAAARALASGDPLGALKRVSLRDDAPALALRGIAMAQLGDLTRAKALLRSAARAFGAKDAVARARCVVAEAEVALASRDLGWPAGMLDAARRTLEEHGDSLNAAHARHLEIRRLILVGRLDEAERALAGLDPAPFPPAWRTADELVAAGIAIRRLKTRDARAALARAERAALQARIPALTAEVESASLLLNTPAARLIAQGKERFLLLEEVEALLASKDSRRGRMPSCRAECPHGHLHHRTPRVVRPRTGTGRSMARRMFPETCFSPKHLVRGLPTNRIAPVCVSRSGVCAGCFNR